MKEEMLRELSLQDSELRYRRLFEAAQDGILILDAITGMIEDVNPYLIKMLGYSREEFVEKKLWEVGAFRDIKASKDAFEALQENEYIRYEDLPLKTKDGRLIQVEFVSSVYVAGGEKVIQCNIRDITEHKRIILALQANEKKYFNLLNQSSDGIFIIDLLGNILTVNKAMCRELQFSEQEFLSMKIWDIIPEQFMDQYRVKLTKILAGESFEEAAEYEVRGKYGRNHYVEVLSTPHYNDKDIIGFQGIARDITSRKQAEEALQESELRNRRLVEHLPTVVYTNAVGDTSSTLYVSPQIESLVGYTPEQWLADPKLWSKRLHPEDRQRVLAKIASTDQNQEPFEMEYRLIASDGGVVWVHDQIVRMKDVAGQDQLWQGIMLNITERKLAEEMLQKALRQTTRGNSTLQALSLAAQAAQRAHTPQDIYQAVGDAIKELGFNLVIYNIDLEKREISLAFMNHAQKLASAAEKLVGLSAKTHRFPLTAGGFYDRILSEPGAQIFFDIGAALTEALPRHLRPFTKQLISLVGIKQGIYAAINVGGKPQSIMIVSGGDLGEADVPAMNILAAQISVALENATLIESLQGSNRELAMAYDATIVGWSRALDLRDRETEGHSQRVTAMAVKLASTFGFSEAALLQLRWGALLHDIGKMGVPDGILLKPGSLTEEEWVVMKKHPAFAYEMLSPIRHLQLALDIPYCHHEKWDGTGYPRGLKGAQIPLTARIFAVVDVWDALCSDRPYRLKWSEEKVRNHILAASGTHFDPQVVEAFMQLHR